jgi:hypothetical protein
LFAEGEKNYQAYVADWITAFVEIVSGNISEWVDVSIMGEVIDREHNKLQDSLRAALNDAIEHAFSLESDRFKPIVGAEVLLEIYESGAYMRKFTRETIIKTLHTMRRPGGDDPGPEAKALRA